MISFPDKKYDIIYADPPWRHDSDKKGNVRPLHYPRMSQKEICMLPIHQIRQNDCILYLWTTAPHTADAIDVIDKWGFKYKSQFVWVKDKIGLGYWARNQHELLLIGTCGKVSPPEPSLRISSVFEYKRGRHSEKPLQIRNHIDTMFPDKSKIELFARPLPMLKGINDGWDYWGDEV